MIAYICIGLVAGIFSGLFGIGGGLVAIPALAFMFGDMHLAIGTARAAMVLTTLSSFVSHQIKGSLAWRATSFIAPGVILGAYAGPYLTKVMPTMLLTICFCLLLIGIGIYYLKKSHIDKGLWPLPSWPYLVFAGTVIGLISSSMGLGGGFLTVPFLAMCNIPMRKAIASSTFISFLIMSIGSSAYFIAGEKIDIQAFLTIGIAALLAAPFGTHLAHALHIRHLKQFLGIFFLVVALVLFFTLGT